jgi:hypothetical protein
LCFLILRKPWRPLAAWQGKEDVNLAGQRAGQRFAGFAGCHSTLQTVRIQNRIRFGLRRPAKEKAAGLPILLGPPSLSLWLSLAPATRRWSRIA